MEPNLLEESNRRYRICGDSDPAFKRYTSQLRVLHPVLSSGGTLTLKVAGFKSRQLETPLEIGKGYPTIVLEPKSGTLARVAVLNAASGPPGRMHFHEFFDLVGERNKALQFIRHPGDPLSSTCQAPPHGSGPDAPYVGCIPPILAQDF